MPRINFGTKKIHYIIRRGKRKRSVAIHVAPVAQVIVLAPQHLGEGVIRNIVQKKAHWIWSKQEYFHAMQRLYPKKELISGEQVLLLGRRYRLKILSADGAGVSITVMGRKLSISIPESIGTNRREVIKNILEQWYVEKANSILPARVERYAKILGVKPDKVIVRNQEKRWGSCSGNGILRFNWRILMAPMTVIDYVVVHELCHLNYSNHSTRFWLAIESVLPDYLSRRKWLKENSLAMHL